MKSTFIALPKAISLACICLLPSCLNYCPAQADNLAPTRKKLAALQECLGPNGALHLGDLQRGLLNGWNWKPGHPQKLSPPPPEYLNSLDRDIAACDAASRLTDKTQSQAIIDAVVKDISIKDNDCHGFGMGRNVTVRVTTLKGRALDNGWDVFYKWISTSGFDTAEMRFPQISSPAVTELPPGEYSFRAEKRTTGTQPLTTTAVTVTVGMRPSLDIQLSAP